MNNLITSYPQFQIACYSLLHAFHNPRNIIRRSFANPEIKYYYSCFSIVMIYSSVELYVKNCGLVIYRQLNCMLDPNDLSYENKKDWLFLGKNWDYDNNKPINHKFSRLLYDIPQRIRQRFNNREHVSDIDLCVYSDYMKKFNKAKKLRDHFVHGTFDSSILNNVSEFEKIYSIKIKDNKLLLNIRNMPEKALDFFILCLKLLNYFTLVCFTGIDGNSREHINNSFDIEWLLIHTAPFEYKQIPKQLIDLLDQKLANNP